MSSELSSPVPVPSSTTADEKYQIRPPYSAMFKPAIVQELLKQVLSDHLNSREYDQNETATWTKEIAAAVKAKLKELKLPRYKFAVQVIVGENKGAGVRCGCRTLWDSATDKQASATFINDTIFAVAVAFGVYLY